MRTSTRLAQTNGNPEHTTTNGWTVVGITGEVDLCSAGPIRESVARLTGQGHRHFVLDLRGVTFLDSMGLGTIVAITKHLRARAGSLLLTRPDARILHVFTAGGLGDVYTFHDSAEEATRHAPHGLARWPYCRP